jgi:putative membrane protein
VRIISAFFILAIFFFGVTFAALNTESVTINYYFDQSTISLPLLLAIVFASGCLLGIVVGLWLVLKAKLKNYRMRYKLSMAEKEIENLRAIPLKDQV